MSYELSPRPVAQLGVESRGAFINRTYLHLFGAITAFVALEAWLFQSGIAEPIARKLLGLGAGWLLVLGAFMVVGWLASRVAHTAQSLPAQYAALGGFVVAEALIMVPMLYAAMRISPDIPKQAATATIVAFAALTAIAFVTRKDFSFMRGTLIWMGVVAIGLIALSLLFGFHLGTWFTVAMLAFAGAAILYDTSNVLHHFSEDRYVAGALELFASVALMFWYVLRLYMHSND
ncbi:MAG: Bax inhibitor-1 family protein [Gammaproteobacteria bacterium]|nr:Bax inhibitor-1 family protein [Gammaproteobacteria bacterium]MDH3767832.1 Bax inhibitor-1 family protein [Gammaproteobacteria bacterium]